MLIPSGSKCIDLLLGGGIETGTITQLYGPSGTGKTTLCLMFAKSAAKNYKVAFVDTEGLSGERVKQIFQDISLFSNVYVQEVYTFRQQSSALREIEKLAKNDEVRLVIVDCFTSLYRSELEDEARQIKVKRELTAQLTYLLGLARKMDLAVLITNQMFTDVKTGLDKPLGGTSIDHLSKTILSLERAGAFRRATLIKHRYRKEGESCEFQITDKGIEP
ncbi:MAG: DNA repair and recombination protein RadB [Archaeoglobales archaeon]|jgi:DNA repair protein RadB|nr:DNA repair and recombination protein RadB [Archaeoglobales archaeon]TDA27238.1 MAG: DNA repair and recombination protein RadB [Archaeoglobi archaeon]TDA27266.1 MAG: DNA repair and recombination protein RadB [Archaeoglobi archaeon]TDA29577.1 MAG: DNA repair and recombination protein RadB [Archaeoglobi archaeon]